MTNVNILNKDYTITSGTNTQDYTLDNNADRITIQYINTNYLFTLNGTYNILATSVGPTNSDDTTIKQWIIDRGNDINNNDLVYENQYIIIDSIKYHKLQNINIDDIIKDIFLVDTKNNVLTKYLNLEVMTVQDINELGTILKTEYDRDTFSLYDFRSNYNNYIIEKKPINQQEIPFRTFDNFYKHVVNTNSRFGGSSTFGNATRSNIRLPAQKYTNPLLPQQLYITDSGENYSFPKVYINSVENSNIVPIIDNGNIVHFSINGDVDMIDTDQLSVIGGRGVSAQVSVNFSNMTTDMINIGSIAFIDRGENYEGNTDIIIGGQTITCTTDIKGGLIFPNNIGSNFMHIRQHIDYVGTISNIANLSADDYDIKFKVMNGNVVECVCIIKNDYDYNFPTIDINGVGIGAKIKIDFNSITDSGGITDLLVESEGFDYSDSTTISINSSHGSGFDAVPIVKDGRIVGVKINNEGSNYIPIITISPRLTTGPTVDPTIPAILYCDRYIEDNQNIELNVIIKDSGIGYAPLITIPSPPEEDSNAVYAPNIVNDKLISIDVVTSGKGYLNIDENFQAMLYKNDTDNTFFVGQVLATDVYGLFNNTIWDKPVKVKGGGATIRAKVSDHSFSKLNEDNTSYVVLTKEWSDYCEQTNFKNLVMMNNGRVFDCESSFNKQESPDFTRFLYDRSTVLDFDIKVLKVDDDDNTRCTLEIELELYAGCSLPSRQFSEDDLRAQINQPYTNGQYINKGIIEQGTLLTDDIFNSLTSSSNNDEHIIEKIKEKGFDIPCVNYSDNNDSLRFQIDYQTTNRLSSLPISGTIPDPPEGCIDNGSGICMYGGKHIPVYHVPRDNPGPMKENNTQLYYTVINNKVKLLPLIKGAHTDNIKQQLDPFFIPKTYIPGQDGFIEHIGGVDDPLLSDNNFDTHSGTTPTDSNIRNGLRGPIFIQNTRVSQMHKFKIKNIENVGIKSIKITSGNAVVIIKERDELDMEILELENTITMYNRNVRENFRIDYINDNDPELGGLLYRLYSLLETKAKQDGDEKELELATEMKKKYEIFAPIIKKKKEKSNKLWYVSIGLGILFVILLVIFAIKYKK